MCLACNLRIKKNKKVQSKREWFCINNFSREANAQNNSSRETLKISKFYISIPHFFLGHYKIREPRRQIKIVVPNKDYDYGLLKKIMFH